MAENQANKKQYTKAKHLQPWMFKPGQSGNPKGRPPGRTLKEYAQLMLSTMTDEERQDFFKGMPKEVIWKMAEGNPTDNLKSQVSFTVAISKAIAKKNAVNPSTGKDR